MPRPVSLTAISTCEFTRSRVICTRPPFGVNLTAFESRFHTTCWRRAGSPAIRPVSVSSTVCSRIPFASAAGRTISIAWSDHRAEINGPYLEPQLAGDDPRDVEQVVDELRLRAARCAR